MADIFISYTRSDRDQIEKIARTLEDDGHSVWWDHQIDGGARFASEIERALVACKAVIVAWSAHSVASEWVLDEANVAKSAGKLIPITLDGVVAPIGFRQIQLIDFSKWGGERDGEAFDSLNRSVARFLHGTPVVASRKSDSETVFLKNTLAVLPLDNLCNDSAQQFFVDGMHEALIASLSKISALNVISRTSTKMYTQTTKSLREIGAELGASKLIEGSVMRVGDQVRITVQLIDAATDTHDWAESYDRDLSDILKLQRDAARDIAEQISVALTPAEERRLATAPRITPAAYESYLKGMHQWYKLTPASLEAALEHFDQSLAADPNYAPAYAGIGVIWTAMQSLGIVPAAVSSPKIKAAIDKAFALDGELAQAHVTNAIYNTWFAWDWTGGEKAFRRAIELDASFPDTHAYYAHFLCVTGRSAEAAPQIERALNLDPFNPMIRALYGVVLIFWRRLDEAVEELTKVINAAPNHWMAIDALRYAYHIQENREELFATTQSLYATLGKPAVVKALNRGYKEGGYYRAMSYAADALVEHGKSGWISPTQIAMCYYFAEKFDSATDYIVKAFEAGDPLVPYIRHIGLYSDEFLNAPRVQRVLRELKYPEDAIEVDT